MWCSKTVLGWVIACACLGAAAQTQGVEKDQILVGSITDLSGPVSAVGKPTRQGMLLRLEELNEVGGIHGRKVRLIVEDSGYDPRRAVLAAHKLVDQDKVFAVLGTLGTAQNVATMPVLFEKNVINFYPMAAAREMFEPAHRLKTAFMPTYFDQTRIAVPRLMKERKASKPCVLYQDDDFGLEVLRGAEAGAATLKVALVEKASYKRGATDFSSQMARLKAAGCDLVVLGTILRETVASVSEARKIAFSPVFLTSMGAYSAVTPRLGGKAMDGLYATMMAEIPSADASTQQVQHWMARYRTRFKEEPNEYAAYGYHIADSFIRVLQKAGPKLDVDSFVKALETVQIPLDIFGFMEESFTPTRRLGNPYPRLSQLRDGRWRVVSDYITFNELKFQLGKDGRLTLYSDKFERP
jgi:branched-chain amino acid transport system substrate-binding protein